MFNHNCSDIFLHCASPKYLNMRNKAKKKWKCFHQPIAEIQ